MHKKISSGAVAGIVAGAAVVLIVIVTTVMIWVIRRRKRARVQGGTRSSLHDVDVFPPGLPVVQQHNETPPTSADFYTAKTRPRPGLALLSTESVSAPMESATLVGSSTEYSGGGQLPILESDQGEEYRHLIERLRAIEGEFNRPPPSYYSAPD